MSNPIQIKDVLGVAIFKLKNFIFPDGEVGTAPVLHGPDGNPLFTSAQPGVVSLLGEIEIKNDAGSPVPVVARNGMVKTMTVVTLPAYATGGTVTTTAQDGTATTATVAASAPAILLPANASRRNFRIMNIGTGLASYGYGAGLVLGKGWPVNPASTAGEQGGSDEDTAPFNGVIYGASAAGTTLVIIEG